MLCVDCNNEISAIRLEFNPDADRCVSCQKVEEKKTTDVAMIVFDGKNYAGGIMRTKNVTPAVAKSLKLQWARGANRCTAG